MPPFGINALGWIALVPLFVAVVDTHPLIGFFSGLLTVLVPAFLLSKGIVPVPHPMDGDTGWIYGGYLLFGILLAVLARTTAVSKPFGLRKSVFMAALAVLLELALFTILPLHLALTQAYFPPALKIASYTGIWGVSFLLWFFNFAIAMSIRNPKRLASLAVAWVVIVLLAWPQATPDRTAAPAKSQVQVIQTQDTDLSVINHLNRKSALTVWPELSGSASAYRGNTNELRELSKRAGSFITTFEDDASPKAHNVAALFSLGKESKRYWKRKPFAGEAQSHAAGTEAVAVLEYPYELIGLNICFDSCYPIVMRDTARLGNLSLIALPTLDPVSKGGVVQSMHAAFTPFRAAELGIPIARADVTGYSMIVGSDGEVLAELGTGDGSVSAFITEPHRTVYRRFGDWFLAVCWLIVGGFAVDFLRKRTTKPA